MKIAHVSPTYYSRSSVIGGGEKYLIYLCRSLDLAERFSDRTAENTIIAVGDEGRSAVLEGVRVEVLKGQPWSHNDIPAEIWRNMLRPFDVVFVHQCLTSFGLFVAAQAKIIGKIVVGVDHGGGEDSICRRTREVGNIFDFCFAQSHFAASSFQDIDCEVVVSPGPIDTRLYPPMTDALYQILWYRHCGVSLSHFTAMGRKHVLSATSTISSRA